LLKYHVWTIGCQMNKADSERLESALEQMGFASAQSPDDASVIVLNSCVVRQKSEDKVVGMLNALKPLKAQDPERVVALMGCMVGPKADELQRRFPYVDVFMRPQQYQPLIDLLGGRYGIETEGCLRQLTAKPQVSTFIPIIHGCDKFCTFCIIPYRRGRQRSVPIEDVVAEAEALVRRGVREITLLGQTVDAYGSDLPGNPDLADLLEAVNGVDGLLRIRFLTSHPSDMSDRIIKAVADLDKVCENINLPFQAGDDAILESMRRGYTNKDYRRLIEKIRGTVPNVSISTDVIVGFCGETEAQFQESVKLIKDLRFDKVHVAAYSPREGTIAWRSVEDDVPLQEKKRRLRVVEDTQEKIGAEINAGYLGRVEDVLIDSVKDGVASGRNRNDRLVYLSVLRQALRTGGVRTNPNQGGGQDERSEDRLGEMVKVRIEKTGPWSLQGTIVL